jgi:hypothetical protein
MFDLRKFDEICEIENILKTYIHVLCEMYTGEVNKIILKKND